MLLSYPRKAKYLFILIIWAQINLEIIQFNGLNLNNHLLALSYQHSSLTEQPFGNDAVQIKICPEGHLD